MFSNSVFRWPDFPVELVFRAIVVYFAILLLFRIFGKKEGKEVSPTSMVFLLLMSDALQNSMIGDDKSLIGGIIVVLVFLLINLILDRLKRKSKSIEKVLEGEPRIIIFRGKFINKAIEQERLSKSEVFEHVRKNGIEKISDIKLAVLETNGELSFVKYEND